MSDRENPNPGLWRSGDMCVNLARVAATAWITRHDRRQFAILFDVPCTSYQSAGAMLVAEAFVPFPLDDAHREDFLRALETYHSKF